MSRDYSSSAYKFLAFRIIEGGGKSAGRFVELSLDDLNPGEVVIRVHPEMAHHIEAEEREGLERLQSLVARKVAVQGMPYYHREQYDLMFR